MPKQAAKQITIRTRAQWRNWLETHHLTEEKVFLVSYKKHTGKPSISHRESIEEAICFGWIDTTMKRIDDDRFGRYFVRRKPGAGWSRNTLGYAEELLQAGKMSPHGKAVYLEGKRKLPLDHDRPAEFTVPPDLATALARHPAAEAAFAAWPPSAKKTHLSWLFSAKRQETRDKRIRQLIDAAENGRRVW